MSAENSGESVGKEPQSFDCCVFPAKVFDKARKIEIQPSAAIISKAVQITAPQIFAVKKTSRSSKIYQSFIRNQGSIIVRWKAKTRKPPELKPLIRVVIIPIAAAKTARVRWNQTAHNIPEAAIAATIAAAVRVRWTKNRRHKRKIKTLHIKLSEFNDFQIS